MDLTLKHIENRIYTIRGHQVMLDSDLADMYQVETSVLHQAVKRNLEKFPEMFRFQLTDEEVILLRSQNVISKENHGGRRYLPFAFSRMDDVLGAVQTKLLQG